MKRKCHLIGGCLFIGLVTPCARMRRSRGWPGKTIVSLPMRVDALLNDQALVEIRGNMVSPRLRGAIEP